MAAKIAHIKRPETFSDLQPQLESLLSAIATAAPKGTKDAGKAYSDSYNKAKDVVGKHVAKLTPDEVDWAWKGLELDTPADKRPTDVINSVVAAWDKSAAKYMRNNTGEGDSNKAALSSRLQEFDTAISSQGGTPVKKDE